MRRADRQNRVRAGGGVVVDEYRAPGLPDGHVRADPDSVDGDSLGAAGPQRVDYQLQVPIEDDLLAAADSLLGDVGQVRADGGLGHGDAQTRTGDPGARGGPGEAGPGWERAL